MAIQVVYVQVIVCYMYASIISMKQQAYATQQQLCQCLDEYIINIVK